MYGSTHRAVLDSIMSELDGVAQKDTDRYKFYCPLPHRKEKASAEIWLDGQGKIAVCCHDCGRNTELWQTVVGPRIAKANLTLKTTYTYDHPTAHRESPTGLIIQMANGVGNLRGRPYSAHTSSSGCPQGETMVA